MHEEHCVAPKPIAVPYLVTPSPTPHSTPLSCHRPTQPATPLPSSGLIHTHTHTYLVHPSPMPLIHPTTLSHPQTSPTCTHFIHSPFHPVSSTHTLPIPTRFIHSPFHLVSSTHAHPHISRTSIPSTHPSHPSPIPTSPISPYPHTTHNGRTPTPLHSNTNSLPTPTSPNTNLTHFNPHPH